MCVCESLLSIPALDVDNLIVNTKFRHCFSCLRWGGWNQSVTCGPCLSRHPPGQTQTEFRRVY